MFAKVCGKRNICFTHLMACLVEKSSGICCYFGFGLHFAARRHVLGCRRFEVNAERRPRKDASEIRRKHHVIRMVGVQLERLGIFMPRAQCEVVALAPIVVAFKRKRVVRPKVHVIQTTNVSANDVEESVNLSEIRVPQLKEDSVDNHPVYAPALFTTLRCFSKSKRGEKKNMTMYVRIESKQQNKKVFRGCDKQHVHLVWRGGEKEGWSRIGGTRCVFRTIPYSLHWFHALLVHPLLFYYWLADADPCDASAFWVLPEKLLAVLSPATLDWRRSEDGARFCFREVQRTVSSCRVAPAVSSVNVTTAFVSAGKASDRRTFRRSR